MLPTYAELHCRSHFSFLTGASSPEELMAAAQQRGYAALAITDECSLAGVVRAHTQALEWAEAGLAPTCQLIIGAEVRLSPQPADEPLPASSPLLRADGSPHAPPRLLLLAQTRRGYGNLAQWISVARRRAAKGQYLAYASDLEGRVPNAPILAGLPDCFAILLPDVSGADAAPFDTVLAQAMWLKTWFGGTGDAGRCAIAIELLHRPHDALRRELLPRVAALSGLPLVACGDVLMHSRQRKPLQDVLTATRLNRPVAECGFDLEPNAEAHLRPLARLAELYAPEWLAESVRIAATCRFSLAELRYEYPEEIVPAGHTPASWLRSLTEEGVRRRFPARVPDKVRDAIEHELAVIAQLSFEPYFLTVADIVQWARQQEILCQGRGSAANSAVCYCLGVTEVDPDRTQLLFERFISPERNEPPDIDIDFEHQRREEVMQYIYRKYGRHRAALTGVMICYRPRSALRDVGRALGIDLDRIAALAKSQHWFDGKRIAPERLREQGFDPDSPVCQQWMALTEQLIGRPRHLSQHPGGFVIARDDVSRLVPVENAAMDDRTVIQWDKDDLDALKLIKVDILALGMLSALKRALVMVAAKLGRQTFTMPEIPSHDEAVWAMLGRADSVGLFQVESRAQMSMLPRLQPKEFYDLVIEVAIVRPGPIQGGMVHPYLRRRQGLEPVDYPSAEARQALERTLGVPIFQEQVMQLAILAADFTPGEADRLRRAMAAWKRKGGLGPFHQRLVGRMIEKGYAPEYAERIFEQIQGFGEYGFPESHAASFALLVWVSAWLKCHHPDAFLTGLLNSQPMGFYAPAQLVRDARMHGVSVLPVDVLHSEWDSTLQGPLRPVQVLPGPPLQVQAVRLGFSRINGFRQADAERIVAARQQAADARQPFSSVEDLARRAGLDAHALACLAEGDALRGVPVGPHAPAVLPPEGVRPGLGSGPAPRPTDPLIGHRHQAAWAVRGIDTRATPLLAATRTHEAPATLAAPDLGEEIVADYRCTGLSLQAHPVSLLRQRLAAFRVLPAVDLLGCRPGQLARASGLVTHRQRPGTAKGVVFVTLEDETGSVNVVVWPQVADAQRRPLLAARLLTVYGVWQVQGEIRHLIARRLVDHSDLLNGLVTRSRDFH